MPDFIFSNKDGRKVTITGPEGSTREQAFQKLQERLKTQQPDPSSVPIGGYVGQTLKGAAQSTAGAIDTGLSLAEAAGPAAYSNPITGPAAGLAAVIPKDWRKALTEFSEAPYTPGYETAGRIGYWGAPVAGAAKPAIVGAKAAVTGAKTGAGAAKAAWEAAPESFKSTATGIIGEAAIDHFLGVLPYGAGGLLSVIARHGLRKALEKGGKKAVEGAAEGAGKEAAAEGVAVAPGRLGTVNEHGLRASPGWTPEQEAALAKTRTKPRVRVQAPTRPARDDIND